MNIQLFDFSINLLQAILWQYNTATALQSLLQQKQDWYNQEQTAFWNDWFTNVFNLETANEFGLCVWSIILGIPYFVNIAPDDYTRPIWGFNENPAINTYENFTRGNFTTVRGGFTYLTLNEQRFLLKLRYFQITTPGDIVSINAAMNYLSTDPTCPYSGTITALDGLDMTIVYVFNCNISYNLRQVLMKYDSLIRPAAVGIRYVNASPTPWGFGVNNQNFENGNFSEGLK